MKAEQLLDIKISRGILFGGVRRRREIFPRQKKRYRPLIKDDCIKTEGDTGHKNLRKWMGKHLYKLKALKNISNIGLKPVADNSKHGNEHCRRHLGRGPSDPLGRSELSTRKETLTYFPAGSWIPCYHNGTSSSFGKKMSPGHWVRQDEKVEIGVYSSPGNPRNGRSLDGIAHGVRSHFPEPPLASLLLLSYPLDELGIKTMSSLWWE
ncbi:uncharacterized protein LOC104876899 [Fukomys damarensis]|uniref:uncharacterized protein LOC104876899 n=1 Tax=Fukomys damarensis TaxID=885580 RepID=UPI00053F8EC7|nr:uncharacterized protein LOC104876899 [Fukomys damarensis]